MYDRGQRSFPLFNVACVGRKDGRSDGLYYKMQILARFSKAAKDHVIYHSPYIEYRIIQGTTLLGNTVVLRFNSHSYCSTLVKLVPRNVL